MGRHPSLARENDQVASDPLVVFPVEDALANLAAEGDEDEGAVIIAPDDLHKAKVSGGPPYEIAPEPIADGRLLNERHEVNFVEYLRLVFRFGGFPGYDGIDKGVPGEIAALTEGLLLF
jgi:hypothetical protein